MVIGINLLYLFPRAVGGTETYARGLIEGLRLVDKKNQYVLFCNKESASTFDNFSNFTVVELPVSAKNSVLRSLFEIFIFPYYLWRYKIDIVHSLGYSSPVISPCPALVNIYDLNWYYHPEDFTWFRRIGWCLFVTMSAKLSTGIITSSNCSKKHLIKILKLNSNKIKVVFGGVPVSEKPLPRKYLAKYNIKGKYIFTITADVPHKNIMGLLKAMNYLKKRGKEYVLVIAGLGGRMKDLASKYIKNQNLADNTVVLGWIKPEEKFTLYKYASAYITPSLHEGFGFTIVEAFSSGTPVVSSRAFSLKEVVGNAGLLFNPKNPLEIAEKINPNLAKELVKLGRKRAKGFNWQKSAITTLEIYNSMLKNE
jgi:glycosyltransferase involved in cell wall biosynthesis